MNPSHGVRTGRTSQWNYWCLLLDTAAVSVIFKILNPWVNLAYFLSFFTKSTFLIALIPAVFTLGSMVSQFFWANLVAGLPRKKPAWVLATVIARGTMLLFLAATAFTGHRGGALPIGLFFLALAIYSLANGAVTPLWSAFVAKSFPEARGRFLGYAYFLDGAVGVAGAYGMRYVLNTYPFPASFIVFFAILSVFAVLTIIPAVLYREEPDLVVRKGPALTASIREIPAMLRRYPAYRRYLTCRVLVTFGEMPFAFVTVHGVSALGATGAHVSMYTVLMVVGGLASNLLFGRLGDRFGFVRLFQTGMVVGLVSNLLVLIAGSPEALYPVFFLQGVYGTAIVLSVTNLNISTSPPDRTPIFVGLANAITGPFLGLTPMLGALISRFTGYSFLLIVCAGIYFLDLLLGNWAARGAFEINSVGGTDHEHPEPGVRLS